MEVTDAVVDPEERERQRLHQLADLEWVMSDSRGRRVLWRLLEQAGVFRLSYTGEAQSTAFNEGQRNIGLRLLAECLEAAPEKYALMQTENSK